jgi:hypothetical protein
MRRGPDVPHGLYLSDGQRVQGWSGKIVMDFNTGEPRLEPAIRLERDQLVFAWYEGQLVGIFGQGGAAVKPKVQTEDILL